MSSPLDTLKRFRADFADVEGFYWSQSEALWAFLLAAQNDRGIKGNFLELGVYRGRSAHLVAQFLASDEICVLVDVNDIAAVGERMARYRRRPLLIHGPSDRLNETDARASQGSCRLIHIDGDHSGHAVLTDLDLAQQYLGPRGLIVIDDFFSPRYPQITAATYHWLARQAQYKMVLCGFNKAYLVHARDYDCYESMIRRDLTPYLMALGENVALAKTSYAHDLGCWGAIPERDGLIVGRDQDPADIPY
jgi:predicted O-methyltransferase YrrM